MFWPPEPLYAQRRSMNLVTRYTGERGSTASFPQPQFFCLDTLIRKSYGRATHSSSEAPVSKYVDVGYGGLVCSLANLIPARRIVHRVWFPRFRHRRRAVQFLSAVRSETIPTFLLSKESDHGKRIEAEFQRARSFHK